MSFGISGSSFGAFSEAVISVSALSQARVDGR
jgi:hypothetical protein